MRFALVNHSTGLSQADALRLAGVMRQHGALVAKAWGMLAPALSLLSSCPPDRYELGIFDHSDQAGAAGYHATDPQGKPYGRIFLDAADSTFSGTFALSAIATHEMAETMVDPQASLWGMKSDGTVYALEICDPVESKTFLLGGASVANFVLPAWFDEGAPGPYDHMDTVSAPFATSGGLEDYLITAAIDPNSLSQFKLHPAARTYRRLAKLNHLPAKEYASKC